MKQLAIVFAAWLTLGGVALADESGEEHLRRAREAETSGDYLLAQIEYIAAYVQLNDAHLFHDLARAYELGGKAESAAVYYRRYLAEIDVPPEQRRELLEKIAQLEATAEPAPPERSAEPPPAPLPAPPPEAPPPAATATAVEPSPTTKPPGLAPNEALGSRARFGNAAQRLHTTVPTRTQRRWYGWQLMLSDVASLVLAFQTENGGVFVGGYLLGPMVIHAVNRSHGKMLGSPLLRAGLPVFGGLAGVGLSSCNNSSDEFCGLGEALGGMALGMLAAVVIDYAWASRTVDLPGHVVVGTCEGTARCTTFGYGLSW